MNISNDRISQFSGTPREIGIARGRSLGSKLEQNILRYFKERPTQDTPLDYEKLGEEALPFFRSLPGRFQEELEGMAEGAGITLQRVAEWITVEKTLNSGCSGLIVFDGETSWIGRNNDFRVPEAGGYATIREVTGRIPALFFGMEGDVFTVTGINREQLWLHMHYLPVDDAPDSEKTHYPDYVIMTEALETCCSIEEFREILEKTDREDGSIFFVADGKTNEAVIFESNCRNYTVRKPENGLLFATNHTSSTKPENVSEGSLMRFNRLNELTGEWNFTEHDTPDNIIRILSDDRVEQRKGDYITVESFVVSPARKQIWCTLGGYPAASKGNWTKIEWPWQ